MLKKDSLQKTLQNLVPGYTIELVTVTLSLACPLWVRDDSGPLNSYRAC